MKYLLITLIILTSCTTRKEVKELEQFKSDIVLKIDSLSIKLIEIRETKEFDVKADTTSTDFAIAFAPEEEGEINFTTPLGKFTATKKGNGSITIKGQDKILKSKQKQSNQIQTFEKSDIQSEKTTQQEDERQSQKKTKEVTGSLFARLWWVWIVVVVGLAVCLRFW